MRNKTKIIIAIILLFVAISSSLISYYGEIYSKADIFLSNTFTDVFILFFVGLNCISFLFISAIDDIFDLDIFD